MKVPKITFRYKQNKLLPRKLCANKCSESYISPSQKGNNPYNEYFRKSTLLNKIGYYDLIDSTEHLLKRVADQSKAKVILKEYARGLRGVGYFDK